MSDPPTPKSMKDFDYFEEEGEAPVQLDDERGGLEDQVAAFNKRQKRYTRYLILMTATFAAAVWFVSGFTDLMAYAFSSQAEPIEIGDVTSRSPRDLEHNQWVSVEGITEHRGLTQKLVRGISLAREEYWYFRLLGSRGVFVEVHADDEDFGYATKVVARGRVVDPTQMRTYDALLHMYEERFLAKEHRNVRIIQVGFEPGTGRLPFILMFLFLGGLMASNVVVAVRLIKSQRRKPGQKVIGA